MTHKLAITDILRMPIGQVALLSPKQLYHAQQEAADQLRRAEMLKDWLNAAIAMKYEKISSTIRTQLEKPTGIIHFNDDDYVITTDTPKRPEWDQKLLKQAIDAIAAKGDDPSEYVQATYKVAEKNYTAWPASIRALFEPARILKTGAPTYKLKAQEAA